MPIVPSAILIDLWFGGDPKVRPGPDCGYRAAEAATTAPVQEGNVGAGAGRTGVFNVADVAIMVGVIAFAWGELSRRS